MDARFPIVSAAWLCVTLLLGGCQGGSTQPATRPVWEVIGPRQHSATHLGENRKAGHSHMYGCGRGTWSDGTSIEIDDDEIYREPGTQSATRSADDSKDSVLMPVED